MSARRPPKEDSGRSAQSGADSAREPASDDFSLDAAARDGRLQVPDDLGSLDESAYAPVRLGGPDPDEPAAGAKPGPDADPDGAPDAERHARSATPTEAPVPRRSAGSVRASMRPRKPASRSTTEPATRPGRHARSAQWTPSPLATSRRSSRLTRLLTVTAVLAAVVAVVLLVRPLAVDGTRAPDAAIQLAAERERSASLEAALRRESRQRYAWEQWAREFDEPRYRNLKRRAERRAAAITDKGD